MVDRIHSNENIKQTPYKVDQTRTHSLIKASIAILGLAFLVWFVFGLMGSFYEDKEHNTQTSQHLSEIQKSSQPLNANAVSMPQGNISPGNAREAADEPNGKEARPGATLAPEAN